MLKEGALAVSARHLYEIVRALPEQQVTLKRAHNNYLEVKSGPSEFRIVGLPAEDFPALPRFEKVPFADVKPEELLEMIERTFFAVSTDETRYNLNGVFFEPGREPLRLVATDGHRLSLAERAMSGTFGLKRGVILPKKGLQELKKLLAEAAEAGEDEGETKLGFVENSAIFRRPGVILSMRLIEGLFPDYRQVIPKQGEKVVRSAAIASSRRLRRISLLSTDKAHAVKLELSQGHAQGPVAEPGPRRGEGRGAGRVRRRAAQDRLQRPLPHGRARRRCRSKDVQLELADDLSPGVLQRRRRGGPGLHRGRDADADLTGRSRRPVRRPSELGGAARCVRLLSLDVQDFRNLAQVALAPSPRATVLLGENGQGKTNLLEAIFFLTTLKPLRADAARRARPLRRGAGRRRRRLRRAGRRPARRGAGRARRAGRAPRRQAAGAARRLLRGARRGLLRARTTCSS